MTPPPRIPLIRLTESRSIEGDLGPESLRFRPSSTTSTVLELARDTSFIGKAVREANMLRANELPEKTRRRKLFDSSPLPADPWENSAAPARNATETAKRDAHGLLERALRGLMSFFSKVVYRWRTAEPSPFL